MFKLANAKYIHAGQTWGQFNSGIGIDYLKKWFGIEGIGIEVSSKKLNPEIKLPFLQC